MHANRRKFIKHAFATGAGIAATGLSGQLAAANYTPRVTSIKPGKGSSAGKASIRFSVIGLNHGHIYGQVEAVLKGGGQLVSCYAKEPDLLAAFTKRYPDVKIARSEKEILEDNSIQLVASASIPVDRAPLGIAVMQHGKDYLVDKPGITTLKQLADVKKVQKETKKIYSIMYGERLGNRASVKAGELVKAGAIGKVVQTVNLAPHRVNIKSRPEWFFQHDKYGGIICDIGSHQLDQFLYYTESTEASVVCSQIGNVHFKEYPGLDDFGDVIVRGNGGTGYVRVDWFTPDGLGTWGDGRLTILGTEGYIELRKYIDIAGRDGGNHLFLVDKKETKYMDCSDVPLPFGELLVNDIVNRTETAMSQAHCFLATELALQAQHQAQRLELQK